MADGSTLRSGLCHGPDCQEKITDRSPSQDFCSDGCQARWAAAYVGAAPDPYHVATWLARNADFELTEWQRQMLESLPDGHLRVDLATAATITPSLPAGIRAGDVVVLGDRHFVVAEHTPERTLYEPVSWLERLRRRLWRRT